jgi:hypothetical protein
VQDIKRWMKNWGSMWMMTVVIIKMLIHYANKQLACIAARFYLGICLEAEVFSWRKNLRERNINVLPLSKDHDNSTKIQLQIDIIYLIVFVTPSSAPHYAQVIRFPPPLPLPITVKGSHNPPKCSRFVCPAFIGISPAPPPPALQAH